MVITLSMSMKILIRLARDDDVFYTSKVALREAGVRREYVADINTDDTPAGHFVDHMLEGFATFFSEQLSENIKRGESFNADRAIANGYRILGYKYDSYMVAGCNKFLRIYYARVKAYLNYLEQHESNSLIDGSVGSEVVLQPLDC